MWTVFIVLSLFALTTLYTLFFLILTQLKAEAREKIKKENEFVNQWVSSKNKVHEDWGRKINEF